MVAEDEYTIDCYISSSLSAIDKIVQELGSLEFFLTGTTQSIVLPYSATFVEDEYIPFDKTVFVRRNFTDLQIRPPIW